MAQGTAIWWPKVCHRDDQYVTTGYLARRAAIGIGLALLMVARSAAAQTVEQLQNMSIEQLGSIEVTSVTKSSEPLGDAPAAIYVITHDDIIRSGATTLPEMLRLAPNLEVAQLNNSSYAISARGFNVGDNASLSNKLLVLIDGRSVYSPMFGGVYWDMQQVQPENIERIEVISGPGATLWGANAVNGVINVITRKSSATQGGVITLGTGNLESDVGLQYGGRLGPDLTYRVHGEFSSFRSYPLQGGGSANDAWSTPSGGFRLDWTPHNDSLSVQGDIMTGYQQTNGYIRERDMAATWQHTFDDGSTLQLLTYYDEAARTINFGGPAFDLNTYDIELQHNFKIGTWNNIVWGVGERNFGYRFENNGLALIPDHQNLNLANIFAQDTISITPSLKLTVGLKIEDEPYAGPQFMPSIRLAWKPTDTWLLWAAVSRAVRSPTPVDTNLGEFVGPVDVISGSTAFRPETLTAYEMGTRVQASKDVSFSVSTFYDVYDNLRSLEASATPSSLPYTFGNLMQGDVFGVEVWGNYQITDWWRLSAGFNLQHEDLTFLPGSSQVLGLAFVADDPGHQAQIHSSIDFGHGVTWDAYLRDVGMLQHPGVPEYVELNMRLGWNINDAWQVSLNGLNLLHKEHVEFIEGGVTTEIPRSIYAQVRVKF